MVKEIRIFQEVSKSPNIVTFYGHSVVNENVEIYMEPMAMSLSTMSKMFMYFDHVEELSKILNLGIVSIIKGMEFCKTKNILHSDLKLQNILVDARGRMKLSDFGESQYASGKIKTVGTPIFWAPEEFNMDIENLQAEKGDVWKLGIMMYEFLWEIIQ